MKKLLRAFSMIVAMALLGSMRVDDDSSVDALLGSDL
jgi:hypothetical protein